MLKINLTGKPEVVELGAGASLVCAPRDIQILSDAVDSLELATEDEFDMLKLAFAVGKEVVQDWSGLVDTDGNEIAFDPDLIDVVLSDPQIMQPFRAEYMNRMLSLRAEGNGSQPSQNGTSAAGETTARAATKSAKPAPTKRKSRKA